MMVVCARSGRDLNDCDKSKQNPFCLPSLFDFLVSLSHGGSDGVVRGVVEMWWSGGWSGIRFSVVAVLMVGSRFERERRSSATKLTRGGGRKTGGGCQWSTVSSSMTAPKLQQSSASFDNKTMVDNMSHGGRDADATGNIFNTAIRPPPRMPKGRTVGPVLPLESSRNTNDEFDTRVMVKHTNTLGLSPHYAYRSQCEDQARGQQKSTDRKLGPGLVNGNLFYKQVHGQQKSSDLSAIDASFMQAQSHREVGVVHMG